MFDKITVSKKSKYTFLLQNSKPVLKPQVFGCECSRKSTLASVIDVGPTFINFAVFFHALQPYQKVHKGYLDGY